MRHPIRGLKTRLNALAHRNRYILGKHPDWPAMPCRVNVEQWQTPEGKPNLGDALSSVVVDWMLARRGMSPAAKAPVKGTKFLAAIGSILQTGVNTTTVWGAGLHNDRPEWNVSPWYKRMDIRAVRGPHTRDLLMRRGYRVPEVYGDPAVFMPLVYQPQTDACREGKPLVLRHFLTQREDDRLNILTADYGPFIDVVATSSLVVTSSLHGVILAECYGVPAVLYNDGRWDWNLIKYRDWYDSTGRPDFPVARSVEEALGTQPAPLPASDVLDTLRNGLEQAFPYDLWDC